ncbi:hypothetical protein G7045_09185 [Acidovorax sp. HDW3]|uniref:hypothetical protein n=1 Tax=Acidovorax sp. HDW3 TaxID=2714923 RepID=UPI00140843D8|nr:hypothetical protein [Acidovorax sp. HDW3]QIL44418.1 hypothetical protein G7045_09185 [Acidovorax sp. HDW3]
MTPSSTPLPSGRFSGREDFQALVRAALECAGAQGWRELVLSDADFWDWPLGEAAVIEALTAWVRQGQRITLLARSYDEVVRRHPRFVRWRSTWDHKIVCRRCAGSAPSDVPSLLWSPQWALQRLDAERCVGVSGDEPERRVLLKEKIDEWLLRRSTPGFPSTTLGL